jgi:hypothetical protein
MGVMATSHAGMPRLCRGAAARLGRPGALAGLLALVLGSAGASVATATAAQAASSCTTSGITVTCTYTGAGKYSFTVPPGVMSLAVTAVGAAGGDSTHYSGAFSVGGLGASVEDTAVPVSAYQGQTLTVIVGGAGGVGTFTGAAGAGGTPGGGRGGGAGFYWPGGGGGGYSGLLGHSGTTPLVIAAGGGGGGWVNVPQGLTHGGAGDTGSGGSAGGGTNTIDPNLGCPTSDARDDFGCGGEGGTSTAGGQGGAGAINELGLEPGGIAGSNGASLAGGAGGPSPTGGDPAQFAAGGGGGGGGYFGGGGGGSGDFGGGGGGGSSYGTGPGLVDETNTTAAASVTITYTSVELALADLYQTVRSYGSYDNIMALMVSSAEHAVAAGNIPQACQAMNAFITDVRLQAPASARAQLIADAEQIQALLGCRTG